MRNASTPPTLGLTPRYLHQANGQDHAPEGDAPRASEPATSHDASELVDDLWLLKHAAGDVVPCVLAVTGRGSAHFILLQHASHQEENVWLGVPVCMKASRARRRWKALAPRYWDDTPMCRACLGHLRKCRKCFTNVRERIRWPDAP